MESNTPNTFVESYEDGVDRVLNGSYAFLCESTMLDYVIHRNCNLTQIGGLLDSKGYGIATPKGSKWTDRVSQAILFLREKGVIQVCDSRRNRARSAIKSNSTIKRNVLTLFTISFYIFHRCCMINGGKTIHLLTN